MNLQNKKKQQFITGENFLVKEKITSGEYKGKSGKLNELMASESAMSEEEVIEEDI